MSVFTGRSMLMTRSTCSLSIPRAVTSVLISTRNLQLSLIRGIVFGKYSNVRLVRLY